MQTGVLPMHFRFLVGNQSLPAELKCVLVVDSKIVLRDFTHYETRCRSALQRPRPASVDGVAVVSFTAYDDVYLYIVQWRDLV